MTVNEEQVAFYFEIGLGITQWAHVEYSIYELTATCFTQHQMTKLAHGFFSIENFRSKLQFADSIMQVAYPGSPFVADWTAIYTRLTSAARNRNKLAHYTVLMRQSSRAGKRVILTPRIDKSKTTLHQQAVGALGLRDILKIRFEFFALMVSLQNLRSRVVGEQERFPKSSEQASNPPPIHTLRNQIFVMLGHQPKPLKPKP
jgi:hypothetical protein